MVKRSPNRKSLRQVSQSEETAKAMRWKRVVVLEGQKEGQMAWGSLMFRSAGEKEKRDRARSRRASMAMEQMWDWNPLY